MPPLAASVARLLLLIALDYAQFFFVVGTTAGMVTVVEKLVFLGYISTLGSVKRSVAKNDISKLDFVGISQNLRGRRKYYSMFCARIMFRYFMMLNQSNSNNHSGTWQFLDLA